MVVGQRRHWAKQRAGASPRALPWPRHPAQADASGPHRVLCRGGISYGSQHLTHLIAFRGGIPPPQPAHHLLFPGLQSRRRQARLSLPARCCPRCRPLARALRCCWPACPCLSSGRLLAELATAPWPQHSHLPRKSCFSASACSREGRGSLFPKELSSLPGGGRAASQSSVHNIQP